MMMGTIVMEGNTLNYLVVVETLADGQHRNEVHWTVVDSLYWNHEQGICVNAPAFMHALGIALSWNGDLPISPFTEEEIETTQPKNPELRWIP